MTRARLFVTIATQRSGTKALGSALNNGTIVESLGELFTGAEAPQRDPLRRLTRIICARERFSFSLADWHAVLDELFGVYAEEAGRPFLHLDLMYNQLGAFSPRLETQDGVRSRSTLLTYLVSRQVPVIHLVRPVGECLRSEVAMHLSGVAHVDRQGVSSPASPPPWDDARGEQARSSWVARRAGQILYWRRVVEQALEGFRHLTLAYQDTFDIEGKVSAHAMERTAWLIQVEPPGADCAGLFGESRFVKTSAWTDVDFDLSAAATWPWNS